MLRLKKLQSFSERILRVDPTEAGEVAVPMNILASAAPPVDNIIKISHQHAWVTPVPLLLSRKLAVNR